MIIKPNQDNRVLNEKHIQWTRPQCFIEKDKIFLRTWRNHIFVWCFLLTSIPQCYNHSSVGLRGIFYLFTFGRSVPHLCVEVRRQLLEVASFLVPKCPWVETWVISIGSKQLYPPSKLICTFQRHYYKIRCLYVLKAIWKYF